MIWFTDAVVNMTMICYVVTESLYVVLAVCIIEILLRFF
jgi:hypothetical protein